ncbi:MAG: undecaprenyl-phosphate glucose phosphotransferase [Dorea sp.]|nr:undecaprenyl-phosphate glucose phosphotransferase [Dorea sp.]
MIKENRRLFKIFNCITEGVLFFLAYLIATYIRFDVMYGDIPMLHIAWNYQCFFAVLCYVMIVLILCYLTKQYRYNAITQPNVLLTGKLCVVNAVGILLLTAFLYVTRIVDFSRYAIFWFYLISTGLIIVKRAVVSVLFQDYCKKGRYFTNIVVVGNGALAADYIDSVNRRVNMGMRILGYVSKSIKEGLGKNLGRYEDLEQILEDSDIEEIVIALEGHEVQFMPMVIAAGEKSGVKISIIPFYNNYIPNHPSIEVIGNSKLMNIRQIPLDNIILAFLKRGMDIVGSILLIIITSPVMLLVAVGIRMSSPGPVLFKQERIGRYKRPFTMYKFRSMRVNAAETTGWSKDVDPRKTKFGSFIRKCSLDELPQFFNVLKGDMSLIGPRPEVPFHVEHFKDEIPLYLVRQQVRPGITGWAQVKGFRGNTSIKGRIECDIWYIENWSLFLDIKILFMTVFGGMINQEKLS